MVEEEILAANIPEMANQIANDLQRDDRGLENPTENGNGQGLRRPASRSGETSAASRRRRNNEYENDDESNDDESNDELIYESNDDDFSSIGKSIC